MAFVNVGASYANGARIPTKKALKEELANNPDNVVFEKTSPLDTSGMPETIKVGDITGGTKLTVCGPDPYVSRRWWATVERSGDKVTVK